MQNHMDNLGYLLNKSARLLKWELNNKLDQFGLTSAQWSVLKDIHLHEGEAEIQKLTPAAIADRLNIDRPTLSGVMYRLSQKEWVTTTQNPEDRRSQIVMLTDKARDIILEAERLSDDTVQKALRNFNENEINAMKGYLQRIIGNFDK